MFKVFSLLFMVTNFSNSYLAFVASHSSTFFSLINNYIVEFISTHWPCALASLT